MALALVFGAKRMEVDLAFVTQLELDPTTLTARYMIRDVAARICTLEASPSFLTQVTHKLSSLRSACELVETNFHRLAPIDRQKDKQVLHITPCKVVDRCGLHNLCTTLQKGGKEKERWL